MSEFFILKPFAFKRLSERRLQMDTRPLAWARGATLALDAVALSDIPPYDLATRDGWRYLPMRVIGILNRCHF